MHVRMLSSLILVAATWLYSCDDDAPVAGDDEVDYAIRPDAGPQLEAVTTQSVAAGVVAGGNEGSAGESTEDGLSEESPVSAGTIGIGGQIVADDGGETSAGSASLGGTGTMNASGYPGDRDEPPSAGEPAERGVPPMAGGRDDPPMGGATPMAGRQAEPPMAGAIPAPQPNLPTETRQAGNRDGGDAQFNDLCPDGEALIGLRGEIRPNSTYPSRVRGVCGVVQADENGVSVIAGALLPMRGRIAGAVSESMCPPNQIVVGFRGRSGGFLDQLQVKCASLIRQNGAVQPIGGQYAAMTLGGNSGQPFQDITCAVGEVAVGHVLRMGDAIDGYSLLCNQVGLRRIGGVQPQRVNLAGPAGDPERGDNESNDRCRSGDVLVGVRGDIRDGALYPGRLQGLCATVDIVEGRVILTERSSLPLRGGSPGQPGESLCPDQQAVVGVRGRHGLLIDQIQVKCAPLRLNAGVVSPGMPQSLGGLFGGNGSDPFPDVDCPDLNFAIGHVIRAGDAIDSYALQCAVLTPTVP